MRVHYERCNLEGSLTGAFCVTGAEQALTGPAVAYGSLEASTSLWGWVRAMSAQ